MAADVGLERVFRVKQCGSSPTIQCVTFDVIWSGSLGMKESWLARKSFCYDQQDDDQEWERF